MLNVEKELALLQRMTVVQLREKYAEVFGEESRSGHKAWLIKRILWRMQANTEGDLSERARRRAMELANDADLRLKAPRSARPAAGIAQRTMKSAVRSRAGNRLPVPGTVITRPYKGRTLEVRVLDGAFEHEGAVYKSLSAVAKAITGTHTNGYLFFRLGKYGIKP